MTRVLGVLGADEDTYWNPGIVVDVNTASMSKDSRLRDKYDQGILVDVSVSDESKTPTTSASRLGDRNQDRSILMDVNGVGGEEETTRNDDTRHDKNDVDSDVSKPKYRLSVYCVSTLHHEKFAIRVMDLTTLNVIAPTKMIGDHHGGVWWTLTSYTPSVRLRIMGIYGMHISAIAFSTATSASSASTTTDTNID